MDVGTLFQLHPAGAVVLSLCVLATMALGALILGGFALLRRAGQRARRLVSHPSQELGLLALWRLERTVRYGPAVSRTERPASNSVIGGSR